MGCWGIGGQWGPVDEQQAVDTIRAALDSGVNLFDTADAYGMGTSEILTGKALRGVREQVYIATKVGNWGRRYDDALRLNSIYGVINCCHASLYRLGTDYIDLYQCHVAQPDQPEVFVEAFEKLKQEGKIREYAISTNDLPSLKALDAAGGCASCQINYSLLSRDAEKDILPYCMEHNIGVLLRGPIAQGLLADKFTLETRFDDSVRQKWNPDGPRRQEFLQQLDRVAALRPLVPQGSTMLEFALQFTLAHPAVTCPIPGMKTPEQARSNAAAADHELDTNTLSAIDRICPPVR